MIGSRLNVVSCIGLLFVISFQRIEGEYVTPRPVIRVTNEDIRDAILQIVRVVRNTEDKLERHEYRDRVLGEQLKRGLIAVDKRIKQWDHFKTIEGTIERLDERLAAIETLFMQKDDREKTHLQTTNHIVEDIQKNLPVVVEKLKADIIKKLSEKKECPPPPPPPPKEKPEIVKADFDHLQKELSTKLSKLSDNFSKLGNELTQCKEEDRNVKGINKKSIDTLDKLQKQMLNGETVLKKYEDKLSEYNKIATVPDYGIPPAQIKELEDWQKGFLQSLNGQKHEVEKILPEIRQISTKFDYVPRLSDIEDLQNSTKHILNTIAKSNSENRNENKEIIETIEKKVSQVVESIPKPVLHCNNDGLLAAFDQLSNSSESFMQKINLDYAGIKGDLKALSKIDDVLFQTAENVMDTKRRIELGKRKTEDEMKQIFKDYQKYVERMFGDRFDVFEQVILDQDSGALVNISVKITEEIDQVWRQIGLMHQQMNASAETLNNLQNQTNIYVNGSLEVMDVMKGKVSDVNVRMHEVEENLNSLLGRLSLVTTEFNRIKDEIQKTLNNLKTDIKETKQAIADQSVGPHNVDEPMAY